MTYRLHHDVECSHLLQILASHHYEPSLSKAQEVRTLACVNERRRELNMINSTHFMKN